MKIIVYDDNPDFGGHQVMTCHGVEALAKDDAVDLLFLVNPSNDRLVARLEHAGIPTRAVQEGRPLEPADLVLCIQGDTYQSTKGIEAARNVGTPCISYLALPHTKAEMGAMLGTLRDRLRHHDINLPDRYITVSEGMKHKLAARNCNKPIDVVPNGVAIPSSSHRLPDDAEPSAPCTLGLAGRIEFKQKQQDLVVDAFRKQADAFRDVRLLLAGSGPDEKVLRDRISGMDSIALLPWQQEMETFYNQIDILLIPSRYEGVPLVMLEALVRGIPVVGSTVDGMQEMLPAHWTFPPGDTEAFTQTLMDVRETWQNDIQRLQQNILENHSLESFKANFVRTVCGL